MTDATPPPRRPVGRPRKLPVAGLSPNVAPRPVGRPPSPELLRECRFKLGDTDLARLDVIAKRLAGFSGMPNRTEAVRWLIRTEDARTSPDT
jgi:hypothetical protein